MGDYIAILMPSTYPAMGRRYKPLIAAVSVAAVRRISEAGFLRDKRKTEPFIIFNSLSRNRSFLYRTQYLNAGDPMTIKKSPGYRKCSRQFLWIET
jgi:hypothetical protein